METETDVETVFTPEKDGIDTLWLNCCDEKIGANFCRLIDLDEKSVVGFLNHSEAEIIQMVRYAKERDMKIKVAMPELGYDAVMFRLGLLRYIFSEV